MGFIQFLPIRYNSLKHLEKYLQEILGNNDFQIKSFIAEQWEVEVPRVLKEAEIEDLKTKMRRHYYN